ncbi:polyprenyl synthetase family protein [Actinomadura fulvescens]|uniref:Family 2 encapsulin nanocompartment cargo protein polyprenyl transferase n=1 Tax=Actinomadura fulvescens TaxID=46160 RepID=A0ABN3QW89_9ACTN
MVTRSAVSQARPSSQILFGARERVEPRRRMLVGTLPGRIRHVVGYHAGWWDAAGRPTDGAGKAVRSALTLASARAVIGREDARGAVNAAAAVELAHDASLLHDDVMDGDRVRRHRAAAWTVFGASEAILAGDVLFVLAMEALDSRELVDVLSAAVLGVCAGQSADLTFEARSEVSMDDCLAMAERKTAALFGAACRLGALAAGAGTETAERYGTFGREVGMAFQLTDDVLGIWGDRGTTGKPVGADLARRKKSLPVVAALTSGTEAGERLARIYGGGGERKLDAPTIARAVRLIETAGGRDWAFAETRRRVQAASAALDEASGHPQGVADLHALAALITRRDH